MTDDELLNAVENSYGPTAIAPRQRGLSASVTSSSQHDSIAGWANILSPEIGYRLGRHFSVRATAPLFFYLRSTSTAMAGGASGTVVSTQQVKHAVVGDTILGAHFMAPPLERDRRFALHDFVSGLLILPTGSVVDGVGTGAVTFNVTNHVEASSPLSPYVNLGFGTSGRIQTRRLQSDQTSRGYVANFAVGGRKQVLGRGQLSIEAFEQLPLGSQRIVQTDPRGEGGFEHENAFTASSGLAEDNGFNTSLDIPINRRLILSGLYSRSLRQHEDIAGFSFTVILFSPAR